MSTKRFTLPKYGLEARVNEFAKQADGSVWLQQGGTVLLATVVSEPPKDFPGFFPLLVDYREPFSAAGKIPGGFFKREGKSSDKEVLTSRLIDRALRPLFPEKYFHSVQITITAYSVDKKHAPHTIALLAASIALSVSKIPLLESVGVAEVARIKGQWVINPDYESSLESDVKIIVAGTKDGICMVEGSTNEVSEDAMVEALFLAHAAVKEHVLWQEEMVREVGVAKDEPSIAADWDVWKQRTIDYLTEAVISPVFKTRTKADRNEALDALRNRFFETYVQELTDSATSKGVVEYIYAHQLTHCLAEAISDKGVRIDGRAYDEIRPVSSQVGLLPCTHGSALFTRGGTQGLVTLTLGSGQDEQKIEDIMGGEVDGSFMLHYNFPAFSVGEVKPSRGPGRREVGHGHLAGAAFKFMLPSKQSFPYTIRVVADILECDGSSSMATVCGSTMAFLNGGVPIKDMVGGVAMGLLKSEKSDFTVLTDISGFEDAFGLMDLKVAGTENGITAIQMDIKYKGGLPRHVFVKAFEQARIGRVHILSEMKKVMSKPNTKLSDLVPQVVMFKIDSNKIGAVIGTGGKVIREIVEKTGASIDIEDGGFVKIFGQPGPSLDRAVKWVKTLGGQIEAGMIFDGVIKKIAEFGVFVELVPGKEGLVHVSGIDREKQRNLSQHYPIDSKIKVRVIEYDSELDRIRLRFLD